MGMHDRDLEQLLNQSAQAGEDLTSIKDALMDLVETFKAAQEPKNVFNQMVTEAPKPSEIESQMQQGIISAGELKSSVIKMPKRSDAFSMNGTVLNHHFTHRPIYDTVREIFDQRNKWLNKNLRASAIDTTVAHQEFVNAGLWVQRCFVGGPDLGGQGNTELIRLRNEILPSVDVLNSEDLHNGITRLYVSLANGLEVALPSNRYASLAFTHLELSMLWAHKSVNKWKDS